jgi:hypothetical protein
MKEKERGLDVESWLERGHVADGEGGGERKILKSEMRREGSGM